MPEILPLKPPPYSSGSPGGRYRRRIPLLIIIMLSVTFCAVVTTLLVLYDSAFEQRKQSLVEMVRSQANLMQAVARFDEKYSADDVPGGAFAATFGQISEAHENFEATGETIEFLLARLDGDRIVFLLKHRRDNMEIPEPVSNGSPLAQPMQRALMGETGTIIGRDYRGERVLAAYSRVEVLNLGIVAKVDMSEVRAPFFRAASLAAAATILVIFLGAVFFRRVGNPLILSLEENEQKYRTLFESSTEGIFLLEKNVVECNEQACRLLGYTRDEILDHTLWSFSPEKQPDDTLSAVIGRAYAEGAMSGTYQVFSWQLRRKDGVLIDIQGSMKAIEVGGRRLVLTSMRDVTEHKKMEVALLEGQERLQGIVNNATSAIFLKDRGGRYLLVNSRFEEFFGVTNAEAVGKTDGELFPNEEPDVFRATDPKIFERNEPLEFEKTIETRMGERTYMVVKFPLHDAAGTPYAVCGIGTDISERKRVEETLQEKNVFLHMHNMVADAANAGLSVDGVLQTILDQVCNHTGWPVGHAYLADKHSSNVLTPSKIWHLNDPEKFEIFRRVTEEASFERGMGLPGRVLASGIPAWIADVTQDSNFSRTKHAQDIGVRGAFAFPVLVEQDVVAVLEFFSSEIEEPDPLLLEVMADVGTQLGRVIGRKRAKDALSEKNSYLRLLQMAAVAANEATDVESAARVVLSEARAFLGWFVAIAYVQTTDARGNRIYIQVWEYEDSSRFQDLEDAAAEIDFSTGAGIPGQAITTGQAVWIRQIDPEDPHLPLSKLAADSGMNTCLAVPVFIGSEVVGSLVFGSLDVLDRDEGLVRVLTDVATQLGRVIERKRAEKDAILRREQLIQADKLASLGTLVAGVAHEINNPNSFIMLNAPLVKDIWLSARNILEEHKAMHGDFRLGPLDFEVASNRVPQLLDAISDGSNRIRGIVANLKDFARQGTSTMDEEVDINKMVQASLSLTQNRLKKSTSRFIALYDPSLPCVRGNFQRLEQVIVNLINNACEALSDSSQSIAISTSVNSRKDRVFITISDEGMGIEENKLSQVRDPFFTTKREFGGTGLGLSISDGIIRDHGGTMNLESVDGAGTKVTVALPVRESSAKVESIK